MKKIFSMVNFHERFIYEINKFNIKKQIYEKLTKVLYSFRLRLSEQQKP